MRLLALGCSFRTAPVEVRERLAFTDTSVVAALDELSVRYGSEAVILGTCNRVELYVARPGEPVAPDADLLAEFLSEVHHIPLDSLRPHLYSHREGEAVRHLFRVVASLDSLIVGEAQIAGQVKRAYELARERNTAGPLLNSLFQQARVVARRVRTETGISRGHVSVSSAAVDYVRQVFDHFADKKILVIGAGKMGELTLRHLKALRPHRIWVTNRSPEKAQQVAQGCKGELVPWEKLDDALARADIVLSTTGAPEPIVTLDRWQRIDAARRGGAVVILDIAVPRDFDPQIHDGDRTCLFNIDDLKRIREATLQDRLKHVAPAEAIVEQEAARFIKDWTRRKYGPVIQRLTQDFEAKRQAVVQEVMARLNGKLTAEERAFLEKAFQRYQNQVLHGPISALTEEPIESASGGHTLLDALRKLFGLNDER
jgi:glutamyl-tRNA reductase